VADVQVVLKPVIFHNGLDVCPQRAEVDGLIGTGVRELLSADSTQGDGV
jgi:hypothetical protein